MKLDRETLKQRQVLKNVASILPIHCRVNIRIENAVWIVRIIFCCPHMSVREAEGESDEQRLRTGSIQQLEYHRAVYLISNKTNYENLP